MRFTAKHTSGPDTLCALVARGIVDALVLDEYGSIQGLCDTLNSYARLNHVCVSAEVHGTRVELSCAHGITTVFTPMN